MLKIMLHFLRSVFYDELNNPYDVKFPKKVKTRII